MSSVEPFGDPTTRRRILDAAWRLIEETGATPKLSDVATEAGVSRQALYLHFGDRAGLLVALVQHIDETFGKDDVVERVMSAGSGTAALGRMIDALAVYSGKVDGVARVLEAAQYEDEAVSAAWRNRMQVRRAHTQVLVQRIADEGGLAAGWSVDAAVDVCYVVLMQGPWRELVREMGWTPDEYAERMKLLLGRSVLASPLPPDDGPSRL